jgi:hypothetical protein
MSEPADWALAYARQASADLEAWELYGRYPEAVAEECHKLLFLQMACEKLCKDYLIRTGARPGDLQASHGYIARPLPVVIRREIIDSGQNPKRPSLYERRTLENKGFQLILLGPLIGCGAS